MKTPEEVKNYFNQGSRRAISVRVILPTTIVVTYEDGAVRQMDMNKEMYGVMASLKDESVFKTAHIKGNSGIVWDDPAGEIDIDTDSIYIYGEAIEEEIAVSKATGGKSTKIFNSGTPAGNPFKTYIENEEAMLAEEGTEYNPEQ